MTQVGLARAIGENPKTLNKWLTGGATPTVISAAKMADCLAVSLDKLIGRVPPGAEALEQLREQTTAIGTVLNEILPDRSIIAVQQTGAPTDAPAPTKKEKAKTKKKQPKRKTGKKT